MNALWVLACGSQPVATGPVEDCLAIELPGLRTTCLVQVAADHGGRGEDEVARQACSQLEPGTWLDECHFRAGEELGRSGYTDLSLRHCAEAGQFARNCVTHSAWGLPPDPDLRSDAPDRVASAMAEFETISRTARAGAPEGVEAEAMDTLMARAWFNLYVGSGVADPRPARAASGLGAAQARTAYAIEAIRLDSEADLVALWASGRALEGEPLADRRKVVGRYSTPVLAPQTERHPHVATYGGGVRLLMDEPLQDLQVAWLEALYFREDVPAQAFLDQLDSELPELRWTGLKLYTLVDPAGSRALALEDEILLAYRERALEKAR